MKFQYNVNVNDQDYLDYHIFWMLRSPYGKKQMVSFRIVITVIFAVFILISLFGGKFTVDAFIGILPLLILLLLFHMLLAKFVVWSIKGQLRTLKKSGKMGYSPDAVIEFGEDRFVEMTPDNKTEHTYSAIERVSIVDDKVIYIHINNVMSYILPFSCFESKGQYDDFFRFLKTKCANIDVY